MNTSTIRSLFATVKLLESQGLTDTQIDAVLATFGGPLTSVSPIAPISAETVKQAREARKAKRAETASTYLPIAEDALAMFRTDALKAEALYESGKKDAYRDMARRYGISNPMAIGRIARTGKSSPAYVKSIQDTYAIGKAAATSARKARAKKSA